MTRLALATLACSLWLTACGAKTGLDAPTVESAETDETPPADAGERSCLPNCTVGHQCCLGSCAGVAVEMPSDCCECLDGEVSSSDCDGQCACKPWGSACSMPAECCSGKCDYPGPDAEKKNCLP